MIAPTTLPPAPYRRALLAWFDREKRALPWRETRAPYPRWLSEIMAQQTQIATMIPYYERFLQRLPNVDALARAELDEVLALWRGLGYYARARNLHAAARVLATDGFPTSAKGLEKLPGFGRYTAAAVASAAFDEPVAVVDGNVARVLGRLTLFDGTPKELWTLAESLIGKTRPGDQNEATMELGALVCTPENPRCDACPLTRWCRARTERRIGEFPIPKARPKVTAMTWACGVVTKRERILMARREAKGLFGGLWELPCVEGMEAGALSALGLQAAEPTPVATVNRKLSHRALRLDLYRCGVPRREVVGYPETRWVRFDELSELGIATAMSRAIEAVRKSPLPSPDCRRTGSPRD